MPTLEEVGNELGISKQAAHKTESRALEKLRDEMTAAPLRYDVTKLVIRDHPAAAVFPLLADDELTGLIDDIAANGLRHEITMHDGMILDGRNRYRACLRGGVMPRYRQYEGEDPIGFVISENLHRRHLNTSQRAMIAARLANMREGGDRRSDHCLDSGSVSQDQAAEKLSVSRAAVQQAAIVKNLGSPELQAAVDSGEVSVNAAAGIARLPHDEQAAALAGGRKEVAAKAAALREQQRAAREGFTLDGETSVGQIIGVCRESGGRFEGFLPDGKRTYRVQVEERFAVAA